MKKLLALVLALVMTLSLCITSNAAYTDAADVDYKEAVDVMSAIGVLKGYDDGSFKPTKVVTRAEAAKIIAYIDLGADLADVLVGAGTTFTDVPASHWAAGYIEYCASAGYVNGIGDGKFNPNGNVTAVEFAKMLLVILGCDAKADGMTGANWAINTAKLAVQSKIFDEADKSINAPATREETAYYAFNAITKGGLYTANAGTTTIVENVTVTTGGKASTWNEKTDFAHSYAKKNFTKLAKGTGVADDFGAPEHSWYYGSKAKNSTFVKAEKVGAYADEAILTYTDAVKGGTLYTDLGKVTLVDDGSDKDNVTAVKLNGKDYSSAWLVAHVASGDKATIGGNGTEIKVYKDSDKYTFVAVQTFVGEITAFAAAKKDANGDVIEGQEAYITVKELTTSNTYTYKTDDFDKQDAKDGTIVLLTATTTDGTNYTVQSAAKAEKVENVAVTGFKANTNVTAGGTTYKYNENAKGADTTYTMTNGATYTFYLDKNGYVVYNEEYTSVSTDYLYVVDATDKKTDDFATKDYRSYKVVDMEGKVSTVKAYDTAANIAAAAKNTIVTMKDDSKNEGYVKFTTVTTEFKSNTLTGNKLDKTQPLVATDIKANAKTVFVLKEGTSSSSSYKTYTGIANVPGYKSASVTAYAVVKDDYATVVFADLVGKTASSSAADELAYIFATTSTNKAIEGDNEYYIFDAVVDGKKTTINAASSTLAASGLVKITQYDSNGFVETVAAVSGDKYTAQTGLSNDTIAYSDPTLTVDGTDYLTTDATVVYMIDSSDDDALTVGTAADLETTKATGDVSIVYVSDKDATVATIYFYGTK